MPDTSEEVILIRITTEDGELLDTVETTRHEFLIDQEDYYTGASILHRASI